MAKELTHILIARAALGKLRESRQQLPARMIDLNLSAFYLGATIPDALYYNVLPLCLNGQNHDWITDALHQHEGFSNDKRAMSFFSSIHNGARAWTAKIAFAAGIITHTVADRIFHEAIDHYTAAWNEKGSVALATHREVETLTDMVLLHRSNVNPGRLYNGSLAQIDTQTKHDLFRFYLGHLMKDAGQFPDFRLLNALKRAQAQQRIFICLFSMRPLYHIVSLSNKFLANRLRQWHTLFYPEGVNSHSFPVLRRLGVHSMSDQARLAHELKRLSREATTDAVQHINIALDKSGL